MVKEFQRLSIIDKVVDQRARSTSGEENCENNSDNGIDDRIPRLELEIDLLRQQMSLMTLDKLETEADIWSNQRLLSEAADIDTCLNKNPHSSPNNITLCYSQVKSTCLKLLKEVQNHYHSHDTSKQERDEMHRLLVITREELELSRNDTNQLQKKLRLLNDSSNSNSNSSSNEDNDNNNIMSLHCSSDINLLQNQLLVSNQRREEAEKLLSLSESTLQCTLSQLYQSQETLTKEKDYWKMIDDRNKAELICKINEITVLLSKIEEMELQLKEFQQRGVALTRIEEEYQLSLQSGLKDLSPSDDSLTLSNGNHNSDENKEIHRLRKWNHRLLQEKRNDKLLLEKQEIDLNNLRQSMKSAIPKLKEFESLKLKNVEMENALNRLEYELSNYKSEIIILQNQSKSTDDLVNAALALIAGREELWLEWEIKSEKISMQTEEILSLKLLLCEKEEFISRQLSKEAMLLEDYRICNDRTQGIYIERQNIRRKLFEVQQQYIELAAERDILYAELHTVPLPSPPSSSPSTHAAVKKVVENECGDLSASLSCMNGVEPFTESYSDGMDLSTRTVCEWPQGEVALKIGGTQPQISPQTKADLTRLQQVMQTKAQEINNLRSQLTRMTTELSTARSALDEERAERRRLCSLLAELRAEGGGSSTPDRWCGRGGERGQTCFFPSAPITFNQKAKTNSTVSATSIGVLIHAPKASGRIEESFGSSETSGGDGGDGRRILYDNNQAYHGERAARRTDLNYIDDDGGAGSGLGSTLKDSYSSECSGNADDDDVSDDGPGEDEDVRPEVSSGLVALQEENRELRLRTRSLMASSEKQLEESRTLRALLDKAQHEREELTAKWPQLLAKLNQMKEARVVAEQAARTSAAQLLALGEANKRAECDLIAAKSSNLQLLNALNELTAKNQNIIQRSNFEIQDLTAQGAELRERLQHLTAHISELNFRHEELVCVNASLQKENHELMIRLRELEGREMRSSSISSSTVNHNIDYEHPSEETDLEPTVRSRVQSTDVYELGNVYYWKQRADELEEESNPLNGLLINLPSTQEAMPCDAARSHIAAGSGFKPEAALVPANVPTGCCRVCGRSSSETPALSNHAEQGNIATTNQLRRKAELETELETLRESFRAAQEEVVRLEAEVMKSTKECTGLRKECSRLKETIATVQRNKEPVLKMKCDLESLQQHLLEAKALGDQYRIQAEVAGAEVERLKSEVELYTLRAGASSKNDAQLESADNRSHSRKLSSGNENGIINNSNANANANAQINQLRSQLMDAQQAAQAMDAIIRESSETILRLTSEKEQQQHNLVSVADDLTRTHAELTSLQLRHTELEAEKSKVEKEKNGLKKECARLRESTARAQEDREALNALRPLHRELENRHNLLELRMQEMADVLGRNQTEILERDAMITQLDESIVSLDLVLVRTLLLYECAAMEAEDLRGSGGRLKKELCDRAEVIRRLREELQEAQAADPLIVQDLTNKLCDMTGSKNHWENKVYCIAPNSLNDISLIRILLFISTIGSLVVERFATEAIGWHATAT